MNMQTPYNFKGELEGLRIILATENEKAYEPYNVGGYEGARALVITMNQWATQTYRGQSIQWLHDKRVQVLSFILNRKVETTNALSTFQSSVIFGYLTGEDGRLSEKGKRFLSDCARAAESITVSRAI